MSSLERLGEAGWLPDVRSEESLVGPGVQPATNRTGYFTGPAYAVHARAAESRPRGKRARLRRPTG